MYDNDELYFYTTVLKKNKTRIHHQHLRLGEELPGLHCKFNKFMENNKIFLEKIFSVQRMEKYFIRYPDDVSKAERHYINNIKLSESLYPILSVVEISLRNAVIHQLERMTGREDWYTVLNTTPGLKNLNPYITQAIKHITSRGENISPSKIDAELTLGFWVSLFNSEYELILWKSLRKAFPNLPKRQRQRKNISAPLNKFRIFRNRIFHHESICWNIEAVTHIHTDLMQLLYWIDKDLPEWLKTFDNYPKVSSHIIRSMGWSPKL